MPELMSSILFIVLGDLLLLGIIVYFLVRYFDRRFKNDQKNRADAIVLKLGINVHPDGQLKERAFLDSAHAMISIIREKHAATPILVVSPIYSPGREDQGSGGGLPLTRMRQLLVDVVAARLAAGDANIGYLDGLSLCGAADAHLLPDDLHPNTEGYRLMGERFHALALSGPKALVRPPAAP